MNTQRIETDPFTGGSPAAYRAARRELRECVARTIGVPVSLVRMAPASVTMERLAGDCWIPACRDVVDEHEWRVRHTPPREQLRLAIRIRA
jgi:hypothetical protein